MTLVFSSSCSSSAEVVADTAEPDLFASKPDLGASIIESDLPVMALEVPIDPVLPEVISSSGESGSDSGPQVRGEQIDNTLDSNLEPEPEENIVTITISAVGDITLGGDPSWGGYKNFMRIFEESGNDYCVFLRNVRHVFESDDLTLANLEGPLTNATEHLNKPYVFSGPPHFARILTSSSVDAVSLANNHSGDYLNRGYIDTVESLEAEDVLYFGDSYNTIVEIKGIKIGLFGYLAWNDGQTIRNRILASIEDLRNEGAELIIAFFHWGSEHTNTTTANQRSIGRFSIDNGVDLVLGSHPHVIQGIEVYEGKNIVYSLGNFCFGGNSNPSDQDTFIFQQTFTFEDGVLLDGNETNIIPARISSDPRRNDFQPIVAQGDDGDRILQRIADYSSKLPSR